MKITSDSPESPAQLHGRTWLSTLQCFFSGWLVCCCGSIEIAVATGRFPRLLQLSTGAGLDGFIDHVVTAQEAGVWKPHPDIYRFAAKRLDTPLERLALVAVHAWDCHGAKRAGAVAGWCSRLEYEPGDVFLAMRPGA